MLGRLHIWGQGPGKEAEMNYLRVLEEPIGHAGTLPALLELGSDTGGTSWGLVTVHLSIGKYPDAGKA